MPFYIEISIGHFSFLFLLKGEHMCSLFLMLEVQYSYFVDSMFSHFEKVFTSTSLDQDHNIGMADERGRILDSPYCSYTSSDTLLKLIRSFEFIIDANEKEKNEQWREHTVWFLTWIHICTRIFYYKLLLKQHICYFPALDQVGIQYHSHM